MADFLGGRTVEYEDGVAVGYRIEARFDPGDPDPDAAATRTLPHGEAIGVTFVAAAPLWNGRQVSGNWDVIWYYTLQHARYTVLAVVFGLALALPLAVPRRAPAGDLPGAARR